MKCTVWPPMCSPCSVRVHIVVMFFCLPVSMWLGLYLCLKSSAASGSAGLLKASSLRVRSPASVEASFGALLIALYVCLVKQSTIDECKDFHRSLQLKRDYNFLLSFFVVIIVGRRKKNNSRSHARKNPTCLLFLRHFGHSCQFENSHELW